MRRYAAICLLAASLAPSIAHAQGVRVVTTCGAMSPFGTPSAGSTGFMTVDPQGNICGGGGGGGTANNNITQWDSVALGAPSNYGTSPGAVIVPGVNSFVTNANSNGSATSANSSPVVIASDQVAVAVKAASGAIASGSIASGAVASGAIASGAVASGAFASGSIGSGAIASGALAAGSIAAGAGVSGAFVAGAIADLAHGQAVMASSVPVAIASNQSTLIVNDVSPYPATAVPITASATGTTGATTATLTNVTNHTTYICGYSIRANATAATTVTDTVTGTISGTLSSELWVSPLTSGLGVDEQIFIPCIPASAVSVSIAVVSGAPGSGGLVSVKAWGYSI